MQTHDMPKILWFMILATIAMGTACSEDEKENEPPPLEVNLQVTGADYLEEMTDALDARGWPSTVWLSSAEVDGACDLVGVLAASGHEIAGKYADQIKEETPLDAQRAEISALSEAIPRCSEKPAFGFRASRFTSNEDTPDLLDEFGYKYLERSARAEFTSVYTFKPYAVDGHDYANLPMPVRVHYGDVGSLCDTSSCGDMSAADFTRYVKTAIDFHVKHREPLVIEWHPSLTNPDDTEGWWEAFEDVLDHLEAKGSDVEYVTAIDLVDRYAEID